MHSSASWGGIQPGSGRISTIDTKVVTLDQYTSYHNIGSIELLKCDVEGGELMVLKGARSLLTSNYPPMLFLEVWPGWTVDFGYSPVDLFTFLRDQAGYEFYHLNSTGLVQVTGNEDPWPGVAPHFLNFLCVVPKVHGARFDCVRSSLSVKRIQAKEFAVCSTHTSSTSR
jgi:hypothetical protein